MPLYNFVCMACGAANRHLMKAADLANAVCLCDKCGGQMKRSPQPPSAIKKEVLDNGVMTKRVERLADAERLVKERSREDNRKGQK